MSRRKNVAPTAVAPTAVAPTAVAPTAVAPTAVAPTAVAPTSDSLYLCWVAIRAICEGLLFPSCWVQYTPIGMDKKPGEKVFVDGIVDGNRVCDHPTVGITRKRDKGPFVSLLNLVICNPKQYLCSEVKQIVKTDKGEFPLWAILILKLQARGVKSVHYRPNFEWSGKDSSGNTIFGLSEDWTKFAPLWEECGDEFEIAEMYGKETWGEYIFSPLNVLEVVSKGLKNGLLVREPVKRGRGKKGKKRQILTPSEEGQIASMTDEMAKKVAALIGG